MDSGAAMSLLPEGKYSVDGPLGRSIVGVGGSPLKVSGIRKLGFFVGKTPMEHTFNVVWIDEGILGMDVSSNLNALLDISGSCWSYQVENGSS